MTYAKAMNAALFLVFLGRLLRGTTGKVFLMVDRLQAHQTPAVRAWVAARHDRLELFPLPRRAPELNPVEYLNQEMKSGVNAEKLPESKEELRSQMQRLLHHLAKLPEHVMSYFKNSFVQYAAGTA